MSRIVAGRYGGRRVTMPPGRTTRPTTDRVREALFSAIAGWAGTADRDAGAALAGLGFLDLYAGSGAVGLEAVSRGADPVLLVEADHRTAVVTRSNVGTLAAAASVRVAPVDRVVREPRAQGFDVVFADPPYELEGPALTAVLEAVMRQGWLVPDGLVVVERSVRTPELDWPAALAAGWSKRYGETVLHYRTAVDPGTGVEH
ncbi:MAG: 16S rRNA (guanine(966)-N(2))-methyltransferase RsmD [Propionibacteriaceae bacterium]